MLPRIFAGARVFILGGGASLTQETADRLRGLHVIAINSTARLAPWAEVLFFADFGWFRDHRPIIDPWPGLVVTVSRRAKQQLPEKLHIVVPPIVKAEPATAGHGAIDVAAAMGAREIVLLGYDCRLVDGRSHCHDDYPGRWSDRLYAETILPMWKGWGERTRRKGISVINASPESAIDEFPQVPLDQVLQTISI